MTKPEKNEVLICNLIDRFEYKETQKCFVLKGTITSSEYHALKSIFETYHNLNKRNSVLIGK